MLSTKRTIVKTFPATIKTDIKINTLHHAMPSALEKTRIDVSVAFSELLFAAVVLLIFGVSDEVHFDLTIRRMVLLTMVEIKAQY